MAIQFSSKVNWSVVPVETKLIFLREDPERGIYEAEHANAADPVHTFVAELIALSESQRFVERRVWAYLGKAGADVEDGSTTDAGRHADRSHLKIGSRGDPNGVSCRPARMHGTPA